MAFNESQREKAEISKQLAAQTEDLDEALKANIVLNEEVKIKENIIQMIKGGTQEEEGGHDDDFDEPSEDTRNNANDNTANISNGTNSGQNIKCKECDYETSVVKHIKSHTLVAHRGEFVCQRGCNIRFKLLVDLDEHIKVKHKQPKPVSYDCDQCESKFGAQYQLRLHIEKKHKKAAETNYECEKCGEIFTNIGQSKMHMNNCEMGYQTVNSKECFFYKNGKCTKGEFCRFLHIEHEHKQYTPKCRNGPSCRYLFSGVCSFFHPGFGVQNPLPEPTKSKVEQSGRSWCADFEDCSRVPNCPNLHSTEDFPKLVKTNKPPLGAKRVAKVWLDY